MHLPLPGFFEASVRGDFEERRYSDDELRRIVDDAARSEVHGEVVGGGSDGHTLAEIRGIAREAGIDPAAVDRAAANLVASEPGGRWSARPGPFARVLHEEHVIPRSLTDAEMRLVALQAERVAGNIGSLRETGDWVEWRDARDRLYVGVVRGQGQTRMRAIADQTAELLMGTAVIAAVGVTSLQTVLGLDPVQAVAGALLIAGATYGSVRVYWKWRSSVARRQLQELLEILEDAVGPI